MDEFKLGATIIIISKDLKALIVQRPKGKVFEGLWAVPGGKREPDDGVFIEKGFCYYPLEYNAMRELYEETGIRVKKSQLQFLCSILVSKELHRLLISFYVYIDKLAKDIPIKLTESQNYKWINKNEIQSYHFIVDVGGEISDAITNVEKSR